MTVKTQVDGRIDRRALHRGAARQEGRRPRPDRPAPVRDPARVRAGQRSRATRPTSRTRSSTSIATRRSASRTSSPSSSTPTSRRSVDQLDAQIAGRPGGRSTRARLNLDYARITSPIDGVTGVRLVDPGNVVHATDTTGLVVVTQLDPIAVFFTLPEDDLPAINEAMAERRRSPSRRCSRDGDKPLGAGQAHGHRQRDQPGDGDASASRRSSTTRSSLLWPNQFVKARLRLVDAQGRARRARGRRPARPAGDVRVRRRARTPRSTMRPVDGRRHPGRPRDHRERASPPASRSWSTGRRSSGRARRSRQAGAERRPPRGERRASARPRLRRSRPPPGPP